MPRKLPQVPIQALFVFAVLVFPTFNAQSGYCCFTKFGGTSFLNSEKIRHIELSLMMVLIIQGELKLLSLV